VLPKPSLPTTNHRYGSSEKRLRLGITSTAASATSSPSSLPITSTVLRIFPAVRILQSSTTAPQHRIPKKTYSGYGRKVISVGRTTTRLSPYLRQSRPVYPSPQGFLHPQPHPIAITDPAGAPPCGGSAGRPTTIPAEDARSLRSPNIAHTLSYPFLTPLLHITHNVTAVSTADSGQQWQQLRCDERHGRSGAGSWKPSRYPIPDTNTTDTGSHISWR